MWDYVDYKNKKILDKNAIIRIWDNGDDLTPNNLMDLASMSGEGRKLVRDYLSKSYSKIQKEKPDSFFAKIGKQNVEKQLAKGMDPFDQWYRVSQESQAGSTFMQLLASFLRIFI